MVTRDIDGECGIKTICKLYTHFRFADGIVLIVETTNQLRADGVELVEV